MKRPLMYLIAIPAMLVYEMSTFRRGSSFLQDLIVAFVVFGLAHAISAFVGSEEEPSRSRVAEKTRVDQDWELNMLLKKAITSENRGDWGQAIALFEQVIQRTDQPENAELAWQHILNIRDKAGDSANACRGALSEEEVTRCVQELREMQARRNQADSASSFTDLSLPGG